MLKSKKGYFVGPQIRELIQDKKFENHLNEVEKAAWKSFRNVTTYIYIYRVSQEECARLQEGVPYVKVY